MKKVKHKGDKGYTDLLLGGRIKKSSLVVQAVGEIDELGSFIGLAKTAVASRSIRKILEEIQRDLYIISSEIITPASKRKELELRFERKRIAWLENLCTPKKKWGGCCFFIPGENRVSAAFDVCRTVCRRAERTLWKLNGRKKVRPHILTYVNRLSTFLFVQARDSERRHKTFR